MTPPLRPVEILLVEDSPTDRLIAVEALKQAMVINNLHTVETAWRRWPTSGARASTPTPSGPT